MMQIRKLRPSDAQVFWQLRLEALQQVPSAFAESPNEHRRTPLDVVAKRFGQSSTKSFVLGAFHDHELVGVAGFLRNERVKTRHKGHVWGVYVRPEQRSKGVGRALMSLLVNRVRAIAGLEQLSLAVSTSQAEARKLYLSLGFERYGCERRALKLGSHYADLEYMVLQLAPEPRKRINAPRAQSNPRPRRDRLDRTPPPARA